MDKRPTRTGTLARLRPRGNLQLISFNRSLLAVDGTGFIRPHPELGLFVRQCRLLSRWQWRINDRPPHPSAQSVIEQHSWMGYYISPPSGTEKSNPRVGQGAPQAAQRTIELRLSRSLRDGLHEDVDLTNYTGKPIRFTLTLACDADFADQDNPESPEPRDRSLTRQWRQAGEQVWHLEWNYQARHDYDVQCNRGTALLERGCRLQCVHPDSPPEWDEARGRIRFHVELPPKGHWHACMEVMPPAAGLAPAERPTCYAFISAADEPQRRREEFLALSTQPLAPGQNSLAPLVGRVLEQARRDLADLRIYQDDSGGWFPAAGLPMYMALFGRDILTAGWQAALLGPEMMQGSLEELIRWQGREMNDWRDEQPGRHLHEAYGKPLSELCFDNLGRYYGSITTSAFYPVAVSELWHWTGDRDLVSRFVEPALKGLAWLDRYCDRDNDGFYEYQTNSVQGVKHQAWKDSRDAIVDADGRQVEPPIAACEEQGFVYAAKLQMAEVLWRLGRKDEAKALYRQAGELKKRFNEAFWMEEARFYAMGLDARKHPIRAITSNPGHCIATGIVETDRAAAVAKRMFEDDLFSGWGIRTLSTGNPAYNPYSYHRGTVWPVEQGTFALGFYRYGLTDLVSRIARAQFEAAALFESGRLPECFSGHPRDALHPIPALYPKANWPQAWSSSSVFCLLQSMLGLYPYAPLHLLLVDPHLPLWLPEITLRGLRVGKARIDIRFHLELSGRTDYEILNKTGPLHVLRQPSPWSQTATVPERLHDLLASLLPGK